MGKTITLKLQELGGLLGVCIPADIAKAAQLTVGQPVTLQVPSPPDELHDAKDPTLTLEQMLAQYDPEKFGGEIMATPLVGQEIIK